jgi:hypothetical protein
MRYLLYIFCFTFLLTDLYPADEPAISLSSFKRHLKFLGSDLFEGRGTGSTGSNLSAKYLAEELSSLNLIPLGYNDTYYQYIPMHASKPLPESEFKFYFDGDEHTLSLGEDYFMLNSGEQTYLPLKTNMVFAGYGIVAPEYDYNDYIDIDVKGKIVVMLTGEPYSDDDSWFAGSKNTMYSFFDAKEKLALARGAAGIILLPCPDDKKYQNIDVVKKSFGFEDVKLAYSVTSKFSILMPGQWGMNIFLGSSYTVEDIKRMHYQNSMHSFELKGQISFNGRFKERDFVSSNIVGMIRGSDFYLRDEYVLVTAHYDHLGIAEPVQGDSIYNGVMDNAIGCAALIELARAFSQLNPQPKRSIIFMLVTGEEKGLLGSKYYIDHPIRPLYKTVANLNIDGLAFIDKFKSVVLVGEELSNLREFAEPALSKMDLEISAIPEEFETEDNFTRSDQVAFASAGIPAMLTMDGLDYKNVSKEEAVARLYEYGQNRYHTPFDDLSQDINYDAAFLHIEAIYRIVTELANAKETPKWEDGVPYQYERLRTNAEKR